METARARAHKAYKPGIPGTASKLSVNVSWEMKNIIDAAAKTSGRTQGAEVEYRLNAYIERENRLGGPRVAALLESLAMAATARFGPGWVHDPEAFWQVTEGGLWKEHLVRWRPVVTDAPRVVRPGPLPDGRELGEMIAALGSAQRLLEQMLLEGAATANQRATEIPAPLAEEAEIERRAAAAAVPLDEDAPDAPE
jgi:hypothetical protein